MFTVSEILDDVKKILGTCDAATRFRRMTEAVELLANKGDFDPLIGDMDICAQDCCITLPREVENVFAVNISGRPTMGRDRWFRFHLNGPGDHLPSCGWDWIDGGDSPVIRDLLVPSRVIAFVANSEDAGAELWVYGYDKNNNWIRTKEGDIWKDGYRVPTIYGYAVPDAGAPEFVRIVRVRKAVTGNPIRLSSYDNSLTTGTLIGQYQFDETEPLYRRIRLSRDCCWARIAYRKRVFKITSVDDLIPLHSSLAVLLAIQAIQAYKATDVLTGQALEATAVRLVTEEQETRTPPVTMPVQVDARNMLHDKADCVD